jgi:hypothetical protein
MRYQKQFNRARGEWWIFCLGTCGGKLVKVCKTEKAADSWIAKHS